MAVESPLLDETNRRIVEELQAEARLSMAELGRRVSLSPPAVAERVQRLERAGVITGYHATIDPKAIGYPLAAVVRVRPASRQLHKIPEVAREIPQLKQRLNPAGGLWMAWPKRASGVETDVSENLVRARGLEAGLVDNKVCAIDEVWSGLRFVFRLADRPKPSR